MGGRYRMAMLAAVLAIVGPLVGGEALAGTADVVAAQAQKTGDGLWSFSVTVAHDDAGWEHYANAWVIQSEDGKVWGERVLLHPHDVEQPFTRSLSGVHIPDGTQSVVIRARDSVHGFGGKELTLDLGSQ